MTYLPQQQYQEGIFHYLFRYFFSHPITNGRAIPMIAMIIVLIVNLFALRASTRALRDMERRSSERAAERAEMLELWKRD